MNVSYLMIVESITQMAVWRPTQNLATCNELNITNVNLFKILNRNCKHASTILVNIGLSHKGYPFNFFNNWYKLDHI